MDQALRLQVRTEEVTYRGARPCEGRASNGYALVPESNPGRALSLAKGNG